MITAFVVSVAITPWIAEALGVTKRGWAVLCILAILLFATTVAVSV